MRKRRLIYIAITVLFIAMALTTCGRLGASGEQEKQTDQQKRDTGPFDRNIRRLPPGYLGHDVVPVYERLAKAFPPKTELEPAEAYRKRLKTSYSRDLFAFVCGQPTQDQLIKETRASYNTDKQIMSVTFLPLTGFSSPLAHRSIVVFKEVKTPKEEPAIKNASGDKAIVQTYYEEHYGVASDDVLHLSTDIDFKISPQEARESRDHIGILLVCVIKPIGDPPEYSLLESSLSCATMASPIETFYFQHFVGVDLLEIWVFNKETGTVYVKKRMQ
jgi:hypothetical protein